MKKSEVRRAIKEMIVTEIQRLNENVEQKLKSFVKMLNGKFKYKYEYVKNGKWALILAIEEDIPQEKKYAFVLLKDDPKSGFKAGDIVRTEDSTRKAPQAGRKPSGNILTNMPKIKDLFIQ